jgi:hypothetical protein
MGQVTGGDPLREAVAELYSADPDEFVARRGELAARARTAGDAALAKRIATLRKPTRSAWVVNRLVRADPSVAEQLGTLGAELRAAQQSFDGPALRELSRQRRQLIDALARQAFSVSGQKSPPAGLREEVASTLGAALADPQVTEELRAGALERAVSRDGLESTMEAGPGEWSLGGTGQPAAGTAAGARAAAPAARAAAREDSLASRVVPLPSARHRAPARTGAVTQARPAAKVTALAAARAKAERAQAERVKAERDRQRRAVAAAKQAVKQAEQGARAAAQVEQDQQNTLQLLEEQLADARQQLTEARIRAQRARTRQRQAQRVLDRLLRTPQA